MRRSGAYRRESDVDPWARVRSTVSSGRKVLWIVNTVDEAIRLYETAELNARGHGLSQSISVCRSRQATPPDNRRIRCGRPVPYVLHPGCRDVADVSANAGHATRTGAALIQRFWPAKSPGDRATTLAVRGPRPRSPLPYDRAELEVATEWLGKSGESPLSQRDSCAVWSAGRAELGPRSLCSVRRRVRDTTPITAQMVARD